MNQPPPDLQNAPEHPPSRAVSVTRRGFILAGFVLVSVSVIFSFLSWQGAKTQEALYLSAAAELSGKSLDSYFRHYEQALNVLARDVVGSDGRLVGGRRVDSLLGDFKLANPDLTLVNLLRPDGQMLATTNADAPRPLPFYGNTPSFVLGRAELLKAGSFNIGRPYLGPLAREWILPLRYALRDGDGRLVGIVTAVLTLEKQQSFWRDLTLPENTALGLIRDDGFLVSRYPMPLKMNYEEAYGKPRNGKLIDYLRETGFPERGTTEGYNSVAKADYVFAFRRLPHYPLTLFVSTSISGIQAKWWQQMRFAIALLALVMTGGYALYRWAAKRQLAWEREKAQSDARFEFLAHHDPLTELPNRLLVKDRLRQTLGHASRAGTKAALLFLDLDNFKTVNDSLGHPVGDLLLQAVALRLDECLRDTDTLSRLGGDEFVIILSEVHAADDITSVAEKILEQIAHAFPVEGNDLTTSLSIGIAVYPEDGADFDNLLRKADTAMYQAKESGRNTYRFYNEQMNVDAGEHLRVRQWLRQALAENQFVLHYQPQIDLASQRIIGAEALIRLQHPLEGLIAPGRFIRIAEDSGLIVPIGKWVLREACRQAAAWQRDGNKGLVVAVNLSAVQFLRGDLEENVEDALAEFELDPTLLELELTESILIADTENVLAAVRRLNAKGVRFSIDDFGTGYSSLAYLKRFNVQKLKIDQSFVRDITRDADDAAIVRAVIQMARSLGLHTIAEGVEDEATLAFLRSQGCDEAQGYHFSRPVPAAEFEQRFIGTAAL